MCHTQAPFLGSSKIDKLIVSGGWWQNRGFFLLLTKELMIKIAREISFSRYLYIWVLSYKDVFIIWNTNVIYMISFITVITW